MKRLTLYFVLHVEFVRSVLHVAAASWVVRAAALGGADVVFLPLKIDCTFSHVNEILREVASPVGLNLLRLKLASLVAYISWGVNL